MLCRKVGLDTFYWCKTRILMRANNHPTRQEIMSLQPITSIQSEDAGLEGVQLRTFRFTLRYVRPSREYLLQGAQIKKVSTGSDAIMEKLRR